MPRPEPATRRTGWQRQYPNAAPCAAFVFAENQTDVTSEVVPAVIRTPCIKLCKLDDDGRFCVGCWRSGDEIMRWRELSDAERSRYIDVILPARAAMVSR